MSTGPAVVKTVWTDADFGAMDWHDNAIHAVALEPVPDHPGRLLLDLDYIVEWVAPEAPATTLSFWICPATLVFDRAWDLTTDIDLRGWSFQLSLDAITRSGPDERGRRAGRTQLRTARLHPLTGRPALTPIDWSDPRGLRVQGEREHALHRRALRYRKAVGFQDGVERIRDTTSAPRQPPLPAASPGYDVA
jgi:hypothetical protein